MIIKVQNFNHPSIFWHVHKENQIYECDDFYIYFSHFQKVIFQICEF